MSLGLQVLNSIRKKEKNWHGIKRIYICKFYTCNTRLYTCKWFTSFWALKRCRAPSSLTTRLQQFCFSLFIHAFRWVHLLNKTRRIVCLHGTGFMRILCQMDLFVCNEIEINRNLLSNRLIRVKGIWKRRNSLMECACSFARNWYSMN